MLGVAALIVAVLSGVAMAILGLRQVGAATSTPKTAGEVHADTMGVLLAGQADERRDWINWLEKRLAEHDHVCDEKLQLIEDRCAERLSILEHRIAAYERLRHWDGTDA